VRPFSDPQARRAEVTLFHYALPSEMTAAFSTLPGGRVLQYHNVTPPEFFARSTRHLAASPARTARDRHARRPRRPRPRRIRLQQARAPGIGFCPYRRAPAGGRYAPITDATASAGPRTGAHAGRLVELPLCRPDCAEQEDRGSHQAGRDLQAVRRRGVPVRLRGTTRNAVPAYYAMVRALMLEFRMPEEHFWFTRPGSRRRTWRRSIARRVCTSR